MWSGLRIGTVCTLYDVDAFDYGVFQMSVSRPEEHLGKHRICPLHESKHTLLMDGNDMDMGILW
jgi:hypothetical protein